MAPSMPSRETVWLLPLLAVTLLVAMALTIFLSPAIGVPLLLIAAIFGAFSWFGGRSTSTARMQELRDEARPDVEFTAGDHNTLTRSDRTSESDPAR